MYYQRAFIPRVTKKITLHGLGGKDNFVIDESVSSPIRLFIYANKNESHFDLNGKVRHRLFEEQEVPKKKKDKDKKKKSKK